MTLYTPTDRPDQPADLFLAGSCVASNHWREALLAQLDSTTLAIFNPERTDFPPESLNDPRYHDQVAWERTALRHSRCIALWLDSAKPTSYASRLELGVAIGRSIPCIVGMEPDFPGSIYLRTYLVDPVYLTYAAFERAVLQAASILEARPPLLSSPHPHNLPSTPDRTSREVP
ncbi:MAG: nucleoside 2-deoxyribosyltransferase domain-containing protein [Firmicutes bacterium]|nr:nucleoside 2-deoxyribosyltransferase domain-containing protein [Bacillota bacterium]